MPLGIDVLARVYAFLIIGHVRAQESTVVIVGDETDLLTLAFLSQFLITMLTGYLAHLVFGKSAKREDRSAELLLGQHPEEIGLIFLGINGRGEKDMSVLFAYLRIVPGSDIIASVLIGNAHEFAPFDMTVAQDTRVRRTTGHVFVDEVPDDAALEGIPKIDYMMLKSHLLGVMLRFHDGLDGAAAFLFGETGLLDAVKGAEGDSHDFVALLQKKHSADGGVNATGHAEQNPWFCI